MSSLQDLFKEGAELGSRLHEISRHNLSAYRVHKEGHWTCELIKELRQYLDKLETAINEDADA